MDPNTGMVPCRRCAWTFPAERRRRAPSDEVTRRVGGPTSVDCPSQPERGDRNRNNRNRNRRMLWNAVVRGCGSRSCSLPAARRWQRAAAPRRRWRKRRHRRRRERPAGAGTIETLDPALDALVPADAEIEHLAEGFGFTEGPAWVSGDEPFLLFSDIPGNRIVKWTPDGEVSDFPGPRLRGRGRGRAPLRLERHHRGPGRQRRLHRALRRARLEHRHRRHGAQHGGRHLRGRTLQQPQRPRLQVRRVALLHRPRLRAADPGGSGAGRQRDSTASTRTAR